ncbi:DUF6082 family protein [Streptomyces sp. enrichment culture]|uniref:DUF6082 family protein n=1 Tax=Streptomyces sp. enrichment culture TaxID=1795815 RepID=UPI003F5461BA
MILRWPRYGTTCPACPPTPYASISSPTSRSATTSSCTAGGHVSEEELLVRANNLLRSPVFRQYWEAARSLKINLPTDSSEGQVYRIFEQAMTDLD